MNQERFLDISWGSIFKFAVAGLVFYIIYLIKDLIVWFLFALILSVLFNPAIDFLSKRIIPRVLAVTLVYLGFMGVLAFLIYFTVPTFISEIQQFSQIFPQYFDKISPPLRGLGLEAFESFESFISVISITLGSMASNIFNAIFSIFGGIFSTVFVVTIAIFLSLEGKSVEKALVLLSPKKYENYVLSLWAKSQQNVSGWLGVRVLGMVFVGVISYVAFLLLNVKYPFSLALMAGALEFIPIIGPLIMGIVLLTLVSLDSLVKAIFVLIFFIIIQQIEGNILTPVLTQKFIRLPPALVLISLSAGGVLFGIWGAIFFVPLAGILFEFFRDFLKKRKEEKTIS
ncbi:MAG: hypothetical protein CMI54_04530 [Parcubacteria group bacterium]|nr:hypothetical protein [Parcubacteria group bacterium]|tara:strand:- start:319 stop:1344 length:1026 start_codon:yes stop_codon:yes gene_type:complete